VNERRKKIERKDAVRNESVLKVVGLKLILIIKLSDKGGELWPNWLQWLQLLPRLRLQLQLLTRCTPLSKEIYSRLPKLKQHL
jgi:hypothetical protein